MVRRWLSQAPQWELLQLGMPTIVVTSVIDQDELKSWKDTVTSPAIMMVSLSLLMCLLLNVNEFVRVNGNWAVDEW